MERSNSNRFSEELFKRSEGQNKMWEIFLIKQCPCIILNYAVLSQIKVAFGYFSFSLIVIGYFQLYRFLQKYSNALKYVTFCFSCQC